jgi:putative hydrolase of the HAD superfamily
VRPADVVFVDDRAVNVQTAEDLGMTGHVFSTAERLRQFLGGLVTR